MNTPATFKEIVRAFECFSNQGQPVIKEILEHLRSYLVLSVWFNATEIEVEFDRTPFETLLELQDMLEGRNLRYQIYHRAFEIEVSWTEWSSDEARVETCAYFDKTKMIMRKKILWDADDVKIAIDIRYLKPKPMIAEASMELDGGGYTSIKTQVKHFLGF